MAGVGLQDRRAELDPLRLATGNGHRDERVAGDDARVPERAEAVGLGPLGLSDDLVDGCSSPGQPDPHGDPPCAVQPYNYPIRSYSTIARGSALAQNDELEQLRSDVQYLKDRAAVLDCVAQHARGCDRHDTELLTSTYLEGGVDVHGKAVNAGTAYAAWANAAHAETSQNHLHNITTHTCDIDGDEAHAESYVMVTLLSPDASTATVMCGRYIDRLQRSEGQWRIALRHATVELAFTADARLLQSKYFIAQGYEHGTRDRTDLSYQRPLSADAPA